MVLMAKSKSDDYTKSKMSRATKILLYLRDRGFDPDQIRYIGISLLKLPRAKVYSVVYKYIKSPRIKEAKERFEKEKIADEISKLFPKG